MLVEKFLDGGISTFDIGQNYSLVELSLTKAEIKNEKVNRAFYKIIFENDKENKKAFLLAILSPIFIACFDKGSYDLSFLKDSIKKSKFPYGLNPIFSKIYMNDSDFKKESVDQNPFDDIYVDSNSKINFMINPVDDEYLRSLLCLIDRLVINDNNREKLLAYFDGVDYNILINGRRSILANGIQAFYLRKYVAVRMIDLINLVEKESPKFKNILQPIYDLTSNLKTPRLEKKIYKKK